MQKPKEAMATPCRRRRRITESRDAKMYDARASGFWRLTGSSDGPPHPIQARDQNWKPSELVPFRLLQRRK